MLLSGIQLAQLGAVARQVVMNRPTRSETAWLLHPAKAWLSQCRRRLSVEVSRLDSVSLKTGV